MGASVSIRNKVRFVVCVCVADSLSDGARLCSQDGRLAIQDATARGHHRTAQLIARLAFEREMTGAMEGCFSASSPLGFGFADQFLFDRRFWTRVAEFVRL